MANNVPAKLAFSSVRFIEIDKSDFVAPLSSLSFGGLFYSFDGPVNDIIALADKDTMASLYGEPTDANSTEWWNLARPFLYKSGAVGPTAKIARVVGDGSINGVLAVTDTSIVNSTDVTNQRIDNIEGALNATIVFDTNSVANGGDDSETKLKFFSKYPTAIVRKVALCTSTDFSTADIVDGVSFVNEFSEIPETNELAIAVLDSSNNILERFVVSLDRQGVDGFGLPNYIETLNDKSQYILVYDNESNVEAPISFEAQALSGGTVVAPVTADYIETLALYEDSDSVDVNYFVGNNKIISEMITLCENRLDCQMIWTASLGDVVGVNSITAVSNLVDYTSTTFNRNTTFAEFFGNAGLIYDEYAKKSRWIELAGDLVGLRVLRNLNGAEWEASAGLNNGQIRNILKLAFNPTPSQGIIMGKNKINPIISKYGQGIVSWGIRNYTSKNSSLSDSTTRGLLVNLVRAFKPFLEQKLFEINDEITRGDIKAKMDQYLESVKNGRGVYDYLVIVDSSNNTPQIIDNNQLVVDYKIKSSRVATEIVARATLGSSGVDLATL